MAYVLTVMTSSARSNNYFHSVHDTEEEAKAEQKDLLDKLNNMVSNPYVQHVQVGNATIKLADIQNTQVTSEDEAPGYGTTFGIA